MRTLSASFHDRDRVGTITFGQKCPDRAHPAPVQQAVEGGQLAGDDDQPEDDLVAHFPDFVPEVTLGEKRSGPAADQFEEVERAFGRALSAGLVAAFIDRIDLSAPPLSRDPRQIEGAVGQLDNASAEQ